MPSLPPAGSFAPEVITNEQASTFFENLLGFVRAMIGGNTRETLNIASGSISPTRSFVVVEPEANAASDDLDRINVANRPDGSLLILRNEDVARKVQLRSLQGGSGQMLVRHGSSGTSWLEDPAIHVLFMLQGDIWYEMFRWYGSRPDLFRSNYLGLGGGALMSEANATEAKDTNVTNRIVTPRRLLDALNAYEIPFGAVGATSTMNRNAEVVVGLSAINNNGVSAIARLKLSNLLGNSFAYYFESGEIDLVLNTSGTVSHGFGLQPRLVHGILRCKVGQLGYGVDDEVNIDNTYNADHTRLITIGSSSGGVFYAIGDYAPVIASYTNQTGTPVTLANWKLVIRAWR